jgi:hypothetical protein
VASKFAWLVGKRGLILGITAMLSAVLGVFGHGPAGHSGLGFWEGP